MDGENNGKSYQNGWFGGKTHYFRKHPLPTKLNGGPSQVLDRSVDVLSLSPTAGARFNPRWVGKFYPRVFFGGRKNWKPQKHHVLFKDHFFFWLVSNSKRGLCYKNKVVRGFFSQLKNTYWNKHLWPRRKLRKSIDDALISGWSGLNNVSSGSDVESGSGDSKVLRIE